MEREPRSRTSTSARSWRFSFSRAMSLARISDIRARSEGRSCEMRWQSSGLSGGVEPAVRERSGGGVAGGEAEDLWNAARLEALTVYLGQVGEDHR